MQKSLLCDVNFPLGGTSSIGSGLIFSMPTLWFVMISREKYIRAWKFVFRFAGNVYIRYLDVTKGLSNLSFYFLSPFDAIQKDLKKECKILSYSINHLTKVLIKVCTWLYHVVLKSGQTGSLYISGTILNRIRLDFIWIFYFLPFCWTINPALFSSS